MDLNRLLGTPRTHIASQNRRRTKHPRRATKNHRPFFPLRGESLEQRLPLTAQFGHILGQFPGTGSSAYNDLLTIDAQGNRLTASHFSGEIRSTGVVTAVGLKPVNLTSSNVDSLVTKYSSAGGMQWMQQISGGGALAGLATDSSGNVYLAGNFRDSISLGSWTLNSNGGSDAFVFKLNPDGQVLWGYNFGAAADDSATTLTADYAGNVYLAGKFQGTADFAPGSLVRSATSTAGTPSAFLLKLDTLANFYYVKTFGGGPNQVQIEDIVLDTSGVLYAAGTFTGAPDFDPGPNTVTVNSRGGADLFIFKTAGGNADSFQFVKGFGNANEDTYGGFAINATNAVLAGNFTGTESFTVGTSTVSMTAAGGTNAYVLQMDSLGVLKKANQLGSPGRVNVADVTLDVMGAVYVGGNFSGTIDLDPTAATDPRTTTAASEAFLTKLLPTAETFAWGTNFPTASTSTSSVTAVAVDSLGQVVITGNMQGNASFGVVNGNSPVTLNSRNLPGNFLVMLRQTAVGTGGTLDKTYGEGGQTQIDVGVAPYVFANATAIAVDSQGRTVMAGTLTASTPIPQEGFILVRYLPDGKLDTSFNNDGIVSYPFFSSGSVRGILFQGSKIVLYGQDGGLISAMRFLDNGSLDTTFGNGGEIRTVGGSARSGALQTDQKIVLGGTAYEGLPYRGGDADMVIIRLTANGQLDNGFSDQGIWRGNSDPDDNRLDEINAVAVQGDKILYGGIWNSEYSVVGRLTSTGAYDYDFGDGAVILNALPEPSSSWYEFDSVYAIKVLSNNSFLIGGGTAIARYSANGVLDTSFGKNGFAPYSAESLAIDSAGRIVAQHVGWQAPGPVYGPYPIDSWPSYTHTASAFRLKSNGELDTSFGENGRLASSGRVAVRSNDKIVAANAESAEDQAYFILKQFTASGVLDTSLQKTGFVKTPFAAEHHGQNWAWGATLGSSSEAYIVGELHDDDKTYGVLAKTFGGKLASTFGTDGKVLVEGNIFYTAAVKKGLIHDDIYVGGSTSGSSYQWVLKKFDDQGVQDTAFVIENPTALSTYAEIISEVVVDSSNRLVVTGAVIKNGNYGMFVARFNPDGKLDKTFSGDGIDIRFHNDYYQFANEIVITPAGKILVGGTIYNGSTLKSDIALWQYDNAGVPDKSFNGNGYLPINFNNKEDAIGGLQVLPNGLIVVGGTTGVGSSDSDLALAVVNVDGSFYKPFNTTGKLTKSFDAGDGVGGLAVTSDSKIVVSWFVNGGYAVSRFLLDGTTDPAFSSAGRIVVPTQNPPAAFGDVLVQKDGKIVAVGTSVFNILGNDYDFNFAALRINGMYEPLTITLSNTAVTENAPTGTLVGTLGSTAANTGTTRTYTLTENGGGRFRLNGDRIEIADGSQINFEQSASRTITVQTKDDGNRTHTAKFVIQVANVNEAPGSLFLTDPTIPEQEPVGTVVGRLDAGDPDLGEKLTFGFVSGAGSADNSRFTIDAQGNLRSAEVFDFETRSSYSIRVRVTDQGGLSFESALTVTVLYVDIIPPTVVNTTPRHGESKLYEGTTSLHVAFNEAVVNANSASSFVLASAGVDGLLGTADDVNLSLAVTYANEKSTLTFPTLTAGLYRLTARSSIIDPAAHALDGDGDGVAGGDYREDFVVVARGTASISMLGSPQATGGNAATTGAGGDFNHDGHADLAVIHLLSDTYSVFLGDGAGNLTRTGAPVATGATQPFTIVSGYFNGDLDLDLAIGHQTGTTIKVFLGDGLGGFAAASPSAGVPAFRTNGLAVGDFDRDGKTDLVALSTSGDSFYFLRGNGAGQFALYGTIATTGGSGPEYVATALIDGDEILDLAFVNRNSNTITLFHGVGDGTFTALGTPISTGGTGPFNLDFGYLDADPYLDIAVTNSLSNNVGILLGDGKGGFVSAGAPLATPGFPIAVKIADVDNDSFADVVVGRFSSGIIQAFLGSGNGKFDTSTSLLYGTNPQSFVLDDFSEGALGLEIGVVDRGANAVSVADVTGMPAVVAITGASSVFPVGTGGSGAGQLLPGAQGVFDGVNRLRVGGVDYSAPAGQAIFANGGQTLVLPTASLAGLQVSRQVSVPNTGGSSFARTIDRFFNPTTAAITVSVKYLSNLGSDAGTVLFATSDGDSVPEPTDEWIGTDDADAAGMPAVIHYIHGRGGIAPQSLAVTGDNLEWTYLLTIQPGEELKLANFTVTADTRAAALAAAPLLVGPTRLSSIARTYLGSEEDRSLANFMLNAAPTNVALDDNSLDENSAVGTIVGQLIATDPDPQDSFSYQLAAGVGSDDNDQFTIDSSGRLRSAHVFDFEEQSQYAVRVRVTDAGGLSFEKALTVSIVDLVEPPSDAEPNDTPATAIALVSGTTSYGRIGNTAAGASDVDYYRFTLAPNQMASFSGYSGTNSYVNGTRLRIFDDGGNDLTSYLSYWGNFYRVAGGTYYAELTGPLTTYSLTFSTQTLTGITEVEPNDTPATAQPVAVAIGSTATVRGFIGDRAPEGDPDIYAVTLPANTLLEVSVTNVSGFVSSGSADIFAIDAAGNVLGTNLAYYLPLRYYSFAAQTIYVRFANRSDLKQAYQINFSLQEIDPTILDAEPNDTISGALSVAAGTTAKAYIGNGAAGAADVDMFQITLAPRQLASFQGFSGTHNYSNFTDMKLYDASGNDLTGYITYWGGYYSETGGTFYAAVTGPSGAYTFRYTTQTLTGITEIEPNDTIATAQPVSVSVGSTTTRQGFLGDRSVGADPDIYAVFVPANTILEVSITGVSGFPSSGSSQLEALDADGNRLSINAAYYLPLRHYSFSDQTVYVKFTERSDLKQAYQIHFNLSALDGSILDQENNDTIQTAIPLAPGTTGNGFIGNGLLGGQDVDFYQITLTDHQLASFQGFSGSHNYSNFNDIKLYDAAGNNLSGFLTYWGGFYSETGGTFYAAITGPRAAYTFRYTAQTLTGITEVEDNDSIATAQAVELAAGSTASRQGFLGDRTANGDPDFYAVYVPANTRLEVAVQGVSGFPSSGSALLAAYDGAGNLLVSNPAYYLPLVYFSEVGQTVYVRFTERSDLKQAYQINFGLQATGVGVDGPTITPIADLATNEENQFAVTFSVSDPSSLPGEMLVSVSSSDETLLPSESLHLADDGDGNWSLIGRPALDQSGNATVVVTATDPDGRSTVSRFAVRVLPVNDPPVGVELSDTSVVENAAGAFVGTLSAIDPDGAANSSFELLFDPAGLFEINGNRLQLRPGVAADYESTDSALVIVQVMDDSGQSFVQDFSIEIVDANDAPRGQPASLSIGEDGVAVSTSVLASDPDLADTVDTLSLVIVTPPGRGQATANSDGTFTFRPGTDFQYLDAGQIETVSFTYRVFDQQGAGSEVQTISIEVAGSNDLPTATPVVFDLFADNSRIRLSGADAETPPESLVYIVDTLPARGTLRLNGVAITVGSTFTGVPDLVYDLPLATGSIDESFNFRVRDGGGVTSAPAKARIKSPTVPNSVIWVGGGAANDVFVLDVSGTNLRVTRSGQILTSAIPLANVTEVRVFGLAGQDSLTITGLAKSVVFDGGADADSLVVNGTTGNDAFVIRSGAVGLGTTNFSFANVESTTLNGNAGTDTLTGADVAAVWNISDNDRGTWNGNVNFVAIESLNGGAAGNSFQIAAAKKMTGAIRGGAGFDVISYAAYTTAVTVDLGTGAATNLGSSSAIEQYIGGAANDTFTLSTRTTPATISGGGGTDTIVSVLDANYTLTDVGLSRIGTATVNFVLESIEAATLTGGGKANVFDVSGWTKAATLNGGFDSVIDTVVATGDVDFTLADTSLARTGRPNIVLSGIEGATLTGGNSPNLFTVSGWTRNATLNGGGGSDSVISSNSAGFTLSDAQLRRSTGSVFTLSSFESAVLTGGTNADTFNITDWSQAAILDGGAGTAVDVVVAANDVDYVLNNAWLNRTGLAQVRLNGFESATLTGGASANVFNVSEWTRTATLNGGAGNDRIVAINDLDFTLSDTALARTTLGNITLAAFEEAVLTGGAAANRFTVSGWTRSATIDGAGGTDTVVSVLDANYSLSNNSLVRTAGAVSATFALLNIESAALTGGSGANSFDISGWTNTATISGGSDSAIDTLVAAGDVDFILSDTALVRSGLPTLTLSGIEAANLTGGDSNNLFTVSGWTRNANVNGGGGSDTLINVGSGSFTLNDTVFRRSTSSAFNMTSLENLRLTGGTGNDTFTVTDRTLPLELDGSAGTDALVAAGDQDFVLSNTALVRSGRGNVSLANFETATLTGGAGNNAFDVSGWNKVATINGGAGTDRIIAMNDVDFTLSDTSLARTGFGAITLAALETATLSGGASANRFTISGWTKTALVDGMGGADTIVSVLDANYTLSDAALVRTAGTVTATFTLQNMEGASLTGGGSANTFNVSAWTQAAAISGGSDFATDTVVASGDYNYVLNDVSLVRSGLPPITLSAVEAATISGGAADNSFDVSGWTRNASLNGSGGIDLLVSSNAANFTLTDTQLKRGTTSTFTLTGFEAARITGGATNDTINATGFTGKLVVDGGGGNDTLTAGSGLAILLGGAGNDILQAGNSRSLLIGGVGADQLFGGTADDLLIDGTTVHDGNAAALDAILAEWASANSYQDRIANLRGAGGGLNGDFQLEGANTTSDAFVDTLTGNAGLDWYFATLTSPNKDTVTGLAADEVVG